MPYLFIAGDQHTWEGPCTPYLVVAISEVTHARHPLRLALPASLAFHFCVVLSTYQTTPPRFFPPAPWERVMVSQVNAELRFCCYEDRLGSPMTSKKLGS
jgi:hypothetical protein